jgi:hypothetical protein
VTGTVQRGRGLEWIDGTAGTLVLTKAPVDRPVDEAVRVAPAPPPEVLFSAPTEDESDVLLNTNLRVQFSRDIDPASLKGHIQVKYEGAETPVEFTTDYNPANRTLTITFPQRLERFRHVIVTLGDTVLGTDRQPLKPWTLSFRTGGS